MQYTTLSTTDIRVSRICLGTMSYGHQVAEADGHRQMSAALEQGVNFFDTAEMYPIPPAAPTFGLTETIVGRWLKNTGNRDRIVLASKVSGPSRYPHIRGGKHRLNRTTIEQAVDASLQRLQTDRIDLYQLHWPDRNVPIFGERGYQHRTDEEMTKVAETLEALALMVRAGKIRHIGLSNETPWGTMEFLRIAAEKSLPRMVSVQNAYNLINRHYEVGMAEVSMRSAIGLLAYSPLGYGVLGGRYFGASLPVGSRAAVHPQFALRYRSERSKAIASLYDALARKHGLTLPEVALAFVHRQPFVTSTIIGASTMEQLTEDIASIDVTLSSDVLKGISAIHEEHPNVIA